MKKLITVSVVLSLVIFASSLYAGQTLDLHIGDTVDAEISGQLVSPKVGGIDVSVDGTIVGPGMGDRLWAGFYLFDIYKDNTQIANDYKTFCMDLLIDPQWGSLDAHKVKPIHEDFEWMWGTHYDTLTLDSDSDEMTARKVAAFQLAVWELVHETDTIGTSEVRDLDLESGFLHLEALNTSSVNNNGATLDGLINAANAYLDQDNWTDRASLVMVEMDGKQPFMVQVPVPGAFLLGGIGVSLVGWMKRRRSL